MAVCDACKREMQDKMTFGCDEFPIIMDGKLYHPVRYGNEQNDRWEADKYRCHDCGVRKGGFHHPGKISRPAEWGDIGDCGISVNSILKEFISKRYLLTKSGGRLRVK